MSWIQVGSIVTTSSVVVVVISLGLPVVKTMDLTTSGTPAPSWLSEGLSIPPAWVLSSDSPVLSSSAGTTSGTSPCLMSIFKAYSSFSYSSCSPFSLQSYPAQSEPSSWPFSIAFLRGEPGLSKHLNGTLVDYLHTIPLGCKLCKESAFQNIPLQKLRGSRLPVFHCMNVFQSGRIESTQKVNLK